MDCGARRRLRHPCGEPLIPRLIEAYRAEKLHSRGDSQVRADKGRGQKGEVQIAIEHNEGRVWRQPVGAPQAVQFWRSDLARGVMPCPLPEHKEWPTSGMGDTQTLCRNAPCELH